MKKILLIFAILLLCIVCVSCKYDNKAVKGVPIEFPQPAKEILSNDIEISFGNRVTEKDFSEEDAYVYQDAQVRDSDKIAELFDFDVGNVTSSYGGKKLYKDKNTENRTLIVDDFGCFELTTGIEETIFKMELTERECMKIAKEYLEEKKLFPNDVSLKWTVSSLKTIEASGETLIGYTINFFRKGRNELTVFGNSRITVEVNGNGEIVKIIYNYCDYSSKHKTKLIEISTAIDEIKKGNCYVELEEDYLIPIRIKISSVTLNYWAQDKDAKKSNIQPVYYFTGAAFDNAGNMCGIEIVVQANEC